MNTALINRLHTILSQMTPTTLEDMGHVKLMRRTDTKYVLQAERLPDILAQLSAYYMVLSIDGELIQPYSTVYYDTPHYSMYHDHHNKRYNRYKVRQREYMVSGDRFLEVKFKNNKGETVKRRQAKQASLDALTADDAAFLPLNSPYSQHQLSPVLNNQFMRITLVGKRHPERLTIDVNLQFSEPKSQKEKAFHHLAIIEVKRERDNKQSDIINILQKERINPSGFSKYCMGLAVINHQVKYQLFKPRLRRYDLWDLKNSN